MAFWTAASLAAGGITFDTGAQGFLADVQAAFGLTGGWSPSGGNPGGYVYDSVGPFGNGGVGVLVDSPVFQVSVGDTVQVDLAVFDPVDPNAAAAVGCLNPRPRPLRISCPGASPLGLTLGLTPHFRPVVPCPFIRPLGSIISI